MINHVWSVLCETSLLDQDSKLISLINCLEQITISEESAPDKALPLVVNLVSAWVRSDLNTPSRGREIAECPMKFGGNATSYCG
jgi:hypothetical protein